MFVHEYSFMSSQTPSKFRQPIFVSDDDSSSEGDTSTTEDYNMEAGAGVQWDPEMEAIFRNEVTAWIAVNAKILFALETAKHLSRQAKLASKPKGG